MSKAAEDAESVLAFMRLLYNFGADTDTTLRMLGPQMNTMGIAGITEDEDLIYPMIGTVLRLLLRHANADPHDMFDATFADLRVLDKDIEAAAFEEITRALRSSGDFSW
jgi:hypothetical protein